MRPLALLAALALASASAAAPASKTAGDPYARFDQASSGGYGGRYVNRAMKLLIDVPHGFGLAAPKKNDDVAYQFAFRLEKPRFEVRVALSPLTETPARAKERADCEKKGTCVMANLDSPSEAWGQTVQANVTDDQDVKFFPFPPDGVKKEFAADWGYVSSPFAMTGKHTFNDEGFKFGQVFVLHRNGRGTVYRIVLADDPEGFRELGKPMFYCVRFEGAQPPFADEPAAAAPEKK